MGVPFLDLTAQYRALKAPIDAAIEGVVEAQQFILGPTVERFEAEAASWLGARHAIGVASGTDALLLSLKALELPADSSVVVPSFTFFATAGAVWNAGLRPVFAEVDETTFNVSAETVEAALTDETRAVVVVHLYGQMAPMAPLLALCERRGLALIEDVAQAFGARQHIDGTWRTGGTLGATGAFSFFPTKVLGGFGDGGMVTTEDAQLADRLRRIRVHGGHRVYHHEVVGTNSRLDALQAAVLSRKLPHVADWLDARRRVAATYARALEGVPGLTLPATADGNEHAWGVYTIRTPRRDELRAHLTERGIGSNVYYPLPLHLQECFAELGGRRGELPVTERLAEEVLSLPMFPELTDEQVENVAGVVREFHGVSS